jgi:hypothetical protein
MSPSGFPILQVIRAEGTVRVIVLPVINWNTKSFPVVAPKFIQDGILIVVNDSGTVVVSTTNTTHDVKLFDSIA